MAFIPTPYDPTLIARGIESLGQSIGSGLEERARRKKEEAKLRKTIEILRTSTPPEEGGDEPAPEAQQSALPQLGQSLAGKSGKPQKSPWAGEKKARKGLIDWLSNSGGLDKDGLETMGKEELEGTLDAFLLKRQMRDDMLRQSQMRAQTDELRRRQESARAFGAAASQIGMPTLESGAPRDPDDIIAEAAPGMTPEDTMNLQELARTRGGAMGIMRIPGGMAQMMHAGRPVGSPFPDPEILGPLGQVPESIRGDLGALRKEAVANKSIATYAALQPNIEVMRMLANNPDNVGPQDIALITAFVKGLDPESIVREGEFATAAEAQGAVQRLGNTLNQILSGSKLTQEGRQSMLDTSERIIRATKNAAMREAVRYSQQAEDLMPGASKWVIPPTMFGIGEETAPPLDGGEAEEVRSATRGERLRYDPKQRRLVPQ